MPSEGIFPNSRDNNTNAIVIIVWLILPGRTDLPSEAYSECKAILVTVFSGEQGGL